MPEGDGPVLLDLRLLDCTWFHCIWSAKTQLILRSRDAFQCGIFPGREALMIKISTRRQVPHCSQSRSGEMPEYHHHLVEQMLEQV